MAALTDLLKNQTKLQFAIQLRIDFLIEPFPIKEGLKKTFGCQWLFLYGGRDARLTAAQVQQLQTNINLLGEVEIILMVNDKLKARLYSGDDGEVTLPPATEPTSPPTKPPKPESTKNLTYTTIVGGGADPLRIGLQSRILMGIILCCLVFK